MPEQTFTVQWRTSARAHWCLTRYLDRATANTSYSALCVPETIPGHEAADKRHAFFKAIPKGAYVMLIDESKNRVLRMALLYPPAFNQAKSR